MKSIQTKRSQNHQTIKCFYFFLKGAVMKIEKALINDRLRAAKVS